MGSLYDELPAEFLINFYYEIKKNINEGVLSEAMYYKLELIEKAMNKKGIAILDFPTHR